MFAITPHCAGGEGELEMEEGEEGEEGDEMMGMGEQQQKLDMQQLLQLMGARMQG
jgi:hypothetical protein